VLGVKGQSELRKICFSVLVLVYDLGKIKKIKYYKREQIKEDVLCHTCSHHAKMENIVYTVYGIKNENQDLEVGKKKMPI